MTIVETRLLEDPIFQLNFTLWMLQPLPKEAPVRAILREAGYLLDSISRDLPIPLELRSTLTRLAGSDSAPAPDVLAQGRAGSSWLIIECKGKSFGPDSSNARQAKKVLAAASDVTGALALAHDQKRPAHVAYLTALEHSELLADTLQGLRQILREAGIPSEEASSFGLSRNKDGVYAHLSRVGVWPAALAAALNRPTRVIQVGEEDDPRPLYLIPWDPSVEQSKPMRDYCRGILFSRIAAEAGSLLGRAEVPLRRILMMEDLVSEATFGVSRSWRSKRDLAKVMSEGKRFLGKALGKLKAQLTIALPSDPERLELTLQNVEDQQAAIEALLAADPLGISPSGPENQPGLFDPPE